MDQIRYHAVESKTTLQFAGMFFFHINCFCAQPAIIISWGRWHSFREANRKNVCELEMMILTSEVPSIKKSIKTCTSIAHQIAPKTKELVHKTWTNNYLVTRAKDLYNLCSASLLKTTCLYQSSLMISSTSHPTSPTSLTLLLQMAMLTSLWFFDSIHPSK